MHTTSTTEIAQAGRITRIRTSMRERRLAARDWREREMALSRATSPSHRDELQAMFNRS